MAPLTAGAARRWPLTSMRPGVVVSLLVALAACGGGTDQPEINGSATTDVTTSAIDPEPSGESSDGDVSTSGEAEAGDDVADADVATSKQIMTRSPDAVGDGDPPEGVGTAIIRITDADGRECDVCMWYADERSERSTGLMGVRDLGGPVGMAFRWDAPTSGNFFMFNTPTPLSIAWFSPDGTYLNEADMAPCLTDDSSTCERYGAGGEYDLAIEMFQGEFGKVGIGPGARAEIVELANPATPTICPVIT